jgi:hypothetical protein
MDSMGRHNALLNGHRGEDGAIAAAPVVQPIDMSRLLSRPRGPVEDIPQPPAAPPDVRPAVAARARRDGDKMRRGAMWVLASGVAAIAAIVSYSHIYDLGRAHGGSGVPARLLPLSVDMLILVGELMLLHEADGKGRRFVLGWVLIWSGILATLAANVAYGAAFGVVGAIIWGWPAYSFILAAGGMVAVVKRSAPLDIDLGGEVDIEADSEVDIPAPAETSSPQVGTDIAVDIPLDTPAVPQVGRPRTSVKAATRTSRRTLTAAEKVAAILRDDPDLSNAEVAKKAGVSTKTVQRNRPAPGSAEPAREETP